MGLRTPNPTSAGQRGRIAPDFADLTKGARPLKALTEAKPRTGADIPGPAASPGSAERTPIPGRSSGHANAAKGSATPPGQARKADDSAPPGQGKKADDAMRSPRARSASNA